MSQKVGIGQSVLALFLNRQRFTPGIENTINVKGSKGQGTCWESFH